MLKLISWFPHIHLNLISSFYSEPFCNDIEPAIICLLLNFFIYFLLGWFCSVALIRIKSIAKKLIFLTFFIKDINHEI